MRSLPTFRSMCLTSPVIRALAAVALLHLLASLAYGQDEKKYGFDSKTGGGTGAAFAPAEMIKVLSALAKIEALTITIKGGATMSGKRIAEDLRKMIEDGRMGKGVGADVGVYGETLWDGKVTPDGDRMNISDHHLQNADNKNLGNTLVHEWVHTHQTYRATAEVEPPAYQAGKNAYLQKGGDVTDAPYKNDTTQEETFKEEIANARVKHADSNAPVKGSEKRRSHCGHEYYLRDDQKRVNFCGPLDLERDSLDAAPNHTFFDVFIEPRLDCDRLIIFGADHTYPTNPQATVTVVTADTTGFVSRNDFYAPLLHLPLAAVRDTFTGTFYVLDAWNYGAGILSMRDTDDDGYPETQEVFASRGSFPALATAAGMKWLQHPTLGRGLLLSTIDSRGIDVVDAALSRTFIRDTDASGQADDAVTILDSEQAAFAPTFSGPPIADGTSVQVVAMAGHTVSVVRTDETGDTHYETLATATISGHGVPQAISLGAPLTGGTYVLPIDQTDSTRPVLPSMVGYQDETSEDLVWRWAYSTATPGTASGVAGSHLLLSEIVVTPTAAEFVELTNPTSQTVDLTNYYLSDAWFEGGSGVDGYHRLPEHPGSYPLGTNTDFIVRFPDGASLAPGQTIVIAGYARGVDSTYGAGSADYSITDYPGRAVPRMVNQASTNPPAAGATSLTNGSEFVMLFRWDGATDLVCDVDYVTWGPATTTSRVDKSGLAVDGPDADAVASVYPEDTPDASQSAANAPPIGFCVTRYDHEGDEYGMPQRGCSGGVRVDSPTPPGPASSGLALAALPNPFTESIALSFTLPGDGRVRVAVYDVIGHRVAMLADGVAPAGRHLLRWDGRSRSGARVPSGVYFARLEWGDERVSRTLVRMR